LLLLLTLWLCALANAAVYEVGPDKPIATPGDAPWATLDPGDTVLISWRPEPYRDKWVICRQGTPDAPITVRGVPGPEGQLPVITGDGAVNATGLNFWNEVRGLIKVGGANIPPDTMPRYIVIENLELRAAHPNYQFTGRFGTVQPYVSNAAALYVEKAQNLTIRNCILTDSGNGLFIGSGDATGVTRDILIEGNYIYGNGNERSAFEHNSYTEALGITFQFNRYGPLRRLADGNNLKDRSAGLSVRYNWIEGGNRQLDLVDAGNPELIADPSYRAASVYGNILIEPPDDGNRQIIHYGGDSGDTSRYRQGTLSLYNNTVISYRTDRTTLLRLSSNGERAIAVNNAVFVTAPGSTLSLLDASGTLEFDYNLLKPAWRLTFGDLLGSFHPGSSNIETASPAFADFQAQDFHPTPGSPMVDAGAPRDLPFQYRRHQQSEPRPSAGPADIGAFELPYADPNPDTPTPAQ
jgi:hypothetical protein